MLTGDGRALRFGGEVLKNVAGYDVSRLMAGSLGILGVLLELSLRVLPQPAAELTLVFETGAASALDRFGSWSGTSLPLAASTWVAGCLYARFEGTDATLAAGCGSTRSESSSSTPRMPSDPAIRRDTS